MMFGLCHPLGIEYRPELADMPDHRAWRADRHADYGPLNVAAPGAALTKGWKTSSARSDS